MTLRICSYNIEWLDELFASDNTFSIPNDVEARRQNERRRDAIKTVLETLDADLIGIVEAPNTSQGGTKKTVACLQHLAGQFGLRTRKAITGFPSAGRQELAVLYDPGKVTLRHDPEGTNSRSNPRFTSSFTDDADGDGIKENYKHYRPPLEAKVTRSDGGANFHLMLAHTKSKGIFSRNDWVHWQRESERNRRKLFAECRSVRRRVDEWLDKGRHIVVMGDINDGPGMDVTEALFGCSAVEIVIGDIFEPERILKSHSGRPEWGRYGWEPASASFKDPFTQDYVNVLIDHVLVSQNLPVANAAAQRIWNPFQSEQAKPIKEALLQASDHFPVTLDLA